MVHNEGEEREEEPTKGWRKCEDGDSKQKDKGRKARERQKKA